MLIQYDMWCYETLFQSGRKETVLDLAKFVDKGVQVKLTGGRQVTGTLKGYDQLLNLVLDEAVEFLRDPDDPQKTTDQTRRLGLIVAVKTYEKPFSSLQPVLAITGPGKCVGFIGGMGQRQMKMQIQCPEMVDQKLGEGDKASTILLVSS
ncbi:Sm-like protein LSM7 [Vitis vinifera]|uniref:Sm-like protein LSM7 n=1 Tax=Vitis vinifera TaxID=29760 RepID=A0A438J1Z4_VITVI|nr:Sm-like protein LSM7 [Vitis vinifera]